MDSGRMKLFASLLLLLVVIGWGYMRIRSVRPGAVANNNVTEEFSQRSSPEERRERMDEFAKTANITPEQRKQMQQAREKARESGNWETMRTAMDDILTSQQRQMMRQGFESRRAERDQKMRAALGDAEFKRYQEKMAERRAQRASNGRGGEGRQRRETR